MRQFAASAVTSYLLVWGFLRFLRRRNFLPFAAYCVVLAVVGGIRLS